MKKTLQLCLFLLSCTLFGQDDYDRYCTEIFSSVKVTSDIQYATNFQVLTGEPLPVDLFMDVYEPEGDESTTRPVVIMMHTGIFLPPQLNGSVYGVKTDSAVVEIAHRLAKRGFVVASIDYRLGWNPLTIDNDTRKSTLINALYRGIQDFRTAVRFLKKNEDVYNIDPGKIASFGLGTGGYISYGIASLDKLEKAQIEKLRYIDEMDVEQMMIDPEQSGDINGLSYPDDTSTNVLNIPNHPGYASDVQFCFSAGGALVDTSWVDENSVPMAAAHVVDDPFAQFLATISMGLEDPIIELFGAGWAIPYFNNSGANAILNSAIYDDIYSIAAIDKINALVADNNSYYGQLVNQGNIFPLQYKYPVSGPWNYWDQAYWSGEYCPFDSSQDTLVCNMNTFALMEHPDMSKELAFAYIDTLVGFFIPRAMVAMDLLEEDYYCEIVVNDTTTEVIDTTVVTDGLDEFSAIDASIAPNPSASDFNINVPEEIIQSIRVYDMNGALVKEIGNINQNQYVLKGEEFSLGIYILNINTKDNSVGQKIIVK